MNKHIEMSVPKKMTFTDRVKCFIFTLLPILIGCYLVVLTTSMKLTRLLPLAIIVCALSIFWAYKIYCGFNIDWEYIFIDDELRFSKIINKSRRREIINVNLNKADVVAMVSDNSHNSVLKNPEIKKYNLKSNTANDSWLVSSVSSKGARICVIFDPNEQMLDGIKFVTRSKFFEI